MRLRYRLLLAALVGGLLGVGYSRAQMWQSWTHGTPAVAGGAITHIYTTLGAVGAASGATSVTGTLGQAAVAGHVLVGAVMFQSPMTGNTAQAITGVTDGGGNSYALISDGTSTNSPCLVQTNSACIRGFYSASLTTGGTLTLTAAVGSTTVGYGQIVVSEYSNVAGFDTFKQNFQSNLATGTNTATSGSFTTGYANDMLWGVAMNAAGNGAANAGTSPLAFNLRKQDTTTASWSSTAEDAIQATAGSASVVFSPTIQSNYMTLGVALHP